MFATTDWAYPACDSFTRTVWMLAQGGAVVPLALGLATPLLATRLRRLMASAALGGLLTGLLLPAAQACASPYGNVDRLVARLWLDHVGEAQSLFAAPWPTIFGYAGLLVAGIMATLWQVWRAPHSGWTTLLALQMTALAIACLELRGVYAGVILGAPALAAAIGAARRRGSLALAGAWIGSAGMLYPIAAQALTPQEAGQPGLGTACTDRGLIERLRALRAGTLMAPIDVGAYALAATPHAVIAAPYHRNNAGNAAMYRFFMADPAAARAIATHWRVNYVILCDPVPPGAFAKRLRDGKAPAWLAPVGPQLWQVR